MVSLGPRRNSNLNGLLPASELRGLCLGPLCCRPVLESNMTSRWRSVIQLSLATMPFVCQFRLIGKKGLPRRINRVAALDSPEGLSRKHINQDYQASFLFHYCVFRGCVLFLQLVFRMGRRLCLDGAVPKPGGILAAQRDDCSACASAGDE